MVVAAEEIGCKVYETDTGRFDGLIIGNHIFLRAGMSDRRKVCVMAEEIAHKLYTVGDISDQSKVENVKQEKFARKKAFEKLLPINAIYKAFKEGYVQPWELADYFNLDEQFIKDALIHYRLLSE